MNQTKWGFTEKRGGGNVRGDSALGSTDPKIAAGFDSLAAAEPTPESVVALSHLISELMDKLEDDRLREIAQLRLSGHTNREIAETLQCVERTVERKLARIRHSLSTLIEGQT